MWNITLPRPSARQHLLRQHAVRRSRGSVISWYSSHASGSWTNFDEICRQQKIRTNIGQSSAEILKYFKFKMADGRHVGKYWKCHNSPTNGTIGTKLGWSHSIMSRARLSWCGCHGNSHCLATVHETFSSYGRLEAESVNQFCWNLVYNSKLGTQWQSRDQILFLFKFKMAYGRSAAVKFCVVNLNNMTIDVPWHWPKFKNFIIQDGGRQPSWK